MDGPQAEECGTCAHMCTLPAGLDDAFDVDLSGSPKMNMSRLCNELNYSSNLGIDSRHAHSNILVLRGVLVCTVKLEKVPRYISG